MSDVWSKLAAKNAGKHSNAAYVHKQVVLYHALAVDCRKIYDKAIALQAMMDDAGSNISSPLYIAIIIASYDSYSRCLLLKYAHVQIW